MESEQVTKQDRARSSTVQRAIEEDLVPLASEEETPARLEAAISAARASTGPASSSREGARVQPKLSVGASDDHFEREADGVAADVVQRIRAEQGNTDLGDDVVGRSELAQRVQRVPSVQRVGQGDGFDVSPDFESRMHASRGRALPLDVRRRMEPAFGADFSGVRLHEGPTARRLSAEIGAEAFTTANNVFIGRSDFDAASEVGTELLAHELTHTIQQGGASVGGRTAQRRAVIQRRLSSESRQAFDTAERSNPAFAAHRDTADKYPGTDIDNLTDDEQKLLNDVSSTWRTRLRTKKRRSGDDGEEEQLEALADLIRAQSLAELAARTVPWHAGGVGPGQKYKDDKEKAKKRKFYLKKANEQKKKDRNLLRLGVAAPETREFLKEHGFTRSASAVKTTVNPLHGPKAKTRPDDENALGVSTRADVDEWLRGPRIDVRSTFIGGPILGIRQRAHLFIVYTSRDGRQYYLRGGPGGPDGQHTEADWGPYTGDIIDYDPSAPSTTVLKGPEAEAKFDAMIHAAQRINAMRVPYIAAIGPKALEMSRKEPLQMLGMALATNGENCNRTAWTILDRAGVPTKKPGGRHPGWGKPLGSSVSGSAEMLDDDHDLLKPPIAHTITDAETGGGLLETYLDRAFFNRGPKLPAGTKVTIVAEGRDYRCYEMGSQQHFVKKTVAEQGYFIETEVRQLVNELGMSDEQLDFVIHDDTAGWKFAENLAHRLGIEDANDIYDGLILEYTSRQPGHELDELHKRLSAMTDAQMLEMVMNLPRLGHFAAQLRVSAATVLKMVQSKVKDIQARQRVDLKVVELMPTPLAMNRAVADWPDYPLVDRLANELSITLDEAFDAIDRNRPAEYQGEYLEDMFDTLTPEHLGPLKDGDYDDVLAEWADSYGITLAFCREVLLRRCGAIQPKPFDPETHVIKFYGMWGDPEPSASLPLPIAAKVIDATNAMGSGEAVNVAYAGFSDISKADFELIKDYQAGKFTAAKDDDGGEAVVKASAAPSLPDDSVFDEDDYDFTEEGDAPVFNMAALGVEGELDESSEDYDDELDDDIDLEELREQLSALLDKAEEHFESVAGEHPASVHLQMGEDLYDALGYEISNADLQRIFSYVDDEAAEEICVALADAMGESVEDWKSYWYQ